MSRRGLVYADGFLPVRITSKARRATTQTLEDVTVWDGTTYYGSSPGFPSKYSTDLFPVVGYGTAYPFGVSLEMAVKIFMRPKILRVTLKGLSAFTASAGGMAGEFESDSVYLECDASQDGEFFQKVENQSDLLYPPFPRFAAYLPEDGYPEGAVLNFRQDNEEGDVVVGVAQALTITAYTDPILYKVGDLYYPRIEIEWAVNVAAGNVPTEEDDTTGFQTIEVRSLRRALPTIEDSTVVAVPCKLFGQDLDLYMRCEQKNEFEGSGASATGDSSDLEIEIDVPDSSNGWLGYGGVYDENTGEKV